jgi:hypothetical protein
MKRRRLFLAALLLAAAATGAWLAFARPAPRGNIAQALQTDLSAADEKQMLALVAGLQLEGSSQQQRLELFERLKSRFDAMSLPEKLALILDVRSSLQKAPDGTLADNGRLLAQAYWNRELQAYQKAAPAERRKMIDARIDETLIYENLENLTNAARSLFRGQSGPSQDDLRQMRSQIVRALVDALQNGTPEERATASEYFLDMQNRRTERGLPNRF